MQVDARDYKSSDLYKIRHSAAHIMADAVVEMFPDAKIGIGPPIADGFYYDFQLSRSLTPEDLDEIERRMREIIGRDDRFVRLDISAKEARERFAQQPFKLELIDDILARGYDEYGEPLPSDRRPVLSTYRLGRFEDLCSGPHVEHASQIDPDAIKVLNVAGAYWRGDEKRPMLQRIYATAWGTPEQLAAYLHRIAEAKRRDHRVLGKAMDLFSTSEAVGPGLVLWHPKGATVRAAAEAFSQQAHVLNGYQPVYTPHIGRAVLWETSGHLDFYRDSMYKPIDVDGDAYYLKPMNCPFHVQIYRSRPRSYRDLPLRFAEFGTVYRYELSGVLQGLTRVRGFTQDDAHSFCTPEQVDDEIVHALRFSLYVLRTFGLTNFTAYISTRPSEKAIGRAEDWETATEALRKAVESEGVEYTYDIGGGAFYGPKIVQDALGREWQLSTIQFDFNLPERFGLEYIGSDGTPHRPFMVHRALFGSAERFFAMLIEHFGGAFPLWLAPVQAAIVPITDRTIPYARKVRRALAAAGLRVESDERNERMQAKVREAELDKVPFLLVVGDKEADASTVSVRARDRTLNGAMTVEAFLDAIAEQRALGVPRPLDD